MIALSLVAMLASVTARAAAGAIADEARPIAPVPGALLLASDGTLPDCIHDSFVQLSGGSTSLIVLVSSDGAPELGPWRDRVRMVEACRIRTGVELRADEVLLALTDAGGIWIEDLADEVRQDPLFSSLLSSTLARGGAVGGAGDGARALASARLDDGDRLEEGGLGLLPSSVVHLDHRKSKDGRLGAALAPGVVGWGIAKRTALVLHHGRRVGAMGNGEVTAMIAAHGDWPARVERIDGRDVVDHGDLPPYRLDYLAWRRAAQQRTGPVFPPEEAPAPRVRRGTLILHGGGGVDDDTFDRFIEEAGGKDACFVCIPSAAEVDPGDEPDSYSAENLRERGCDHVFVLHTTRCEVADQDEAFLEPLTRARGVWIDGGRTYRVMDSFEHTRAHRLLFEVLERGGVVAGSSAGAQVLGDFLVRGNPQTNRDLVFDGYTTGFGLLPGVIVDAHFRQRDRGPPFAELLGQYPQLLGIGLDEKTALVIRGRVGQVVGQNAVSFYDVSKKRSSKGQEPLELNDGETYDLERRERGR